MSNDHLVKRDASYVFDPATMKEVEKGSVMKLTQTKIGGDPFKLDENKRPTRIKEGDIIWLMQNGYGVYAKSQIVAISERYKISNLDRFNRIRKKNDPFLNDFYWDSVYKKFSVKGVPNNKKLHIIFVKHQIMDNSIRLYVRTKKGAQSDWITFKNLAEKNEWITDEAPEDVALEIGGEKVYEAIPPQVKYRVSRIWKIHSIRNKDFDHFVPKSVGAPGIFEENIVPLHFSLNRGKSNRIPKEFITVAYENEHRFKDLSITEKIINDWDYTINRGAKFEHQKCLSKKITSQVKRWPVKDQRQFYFSVLKRAFKSSDIITRIEQAENKSIKDFSREELVATFESLRTELALDLDDMFSNVNSN